MSEAILYAIYALSLIFLLTLGYLIYRSRKDSRLWGEPGKTRYKSVNSYPVILKIYKFLNNFPFTRNYIKKLSYRYRLICPCDMQTIANKTVGSCLISWTISIFSFLLIFMTDRKLINLITAGFAIFIINSEVVSRIAKKYEINTLTDMQKMLSEVLHYYYVEYRIDDAIYLAREHLSNDMKAAADRIYRLLLSADREENLRQYYDNIPNKYLRAFASLCIGLMERGDQVIDGKMLFIRNLENLQKEIDIEIEKQQRLNMEFMGVILCVVSPVFCIETVKQFAISLKGNMVDFYYGKQGFLLDIGLMAVISGIYIIMRKSAEYQAFHQSSHNWLYIIDRIKFIRKAMDNYCDKNASKQERLQRELRNNGSNIRARHFVLRSFLIAASVFIVSVSLVIYLHKNTRSHLLTVKAYEMERLTPAAKEIQYEAMANTIETYTRKYTEKPDLVPKSTETLTEIFKKDGLIYNPLIAEALAKDILKRVDRYQKEYISFIDVFICLCISIVAYYIPFIILKYTGAVSKDAMEDEVNQFNALIGMLMYNDSVTVKQILEEMESFAVVFRQSLRICIDDYGSGDIEALNMLKEREPYEPFRRIVDNLMRCDDMPISQAFAEIQVDNDGYISKRKLANEKSIKKRVFRAYALASIPFLLLFAYGLMPALMSSLKEINQLLTEMESMTW